jgi:hypothetical protein
MMGIIFFNCCERKKSIGKSGSELSSEKQFYQFDVRDKIPDHIQTVENLSIFPADIDAPYSIKLIEEGRFGEKGEPFLLNVYSCVVDDQGRVIIRSADSNYEQQLFVFDSDGTFHTKLGRQGKGPGEYGIILDMYSKSNTIFVLDYTSQKLNEYSTLDYKLTRTTLFEEWKAPDNFKFSYVEPRYDGNYHLTFSNLSPKTGFQEIIQMVKDSEGEDVNFEPLRFPVGYKIPPSTRKSKISAPTMSLTFLGTTRTALSQKDELFTNWSREFLIKKYDSTGKYQSAIYYPIQGVPFILEDYTKSAVFSPNVREIEKTLSDNGIDIPDRLPVIERLIIDDENRIWVALPTSSNRNTYEWWVLEESGELLARLTLPRDQPIYDIKNGYLYSEKTNEDTGTEYAVKYRIELTKK